MNGSTPDASETAVADPTEPMPIDDLLSSIRLTGRFVPSSHA